MGIRCVCVCVCVYLYVCVCVCVCVCVPVYVCVSVYSFGPPLTISIPVMRLIRNFGYISIVPELSNAINPVS